MADEADMVDVPPLRESKVYSEDVKVGDDYLSSSSSNSGSSSCSHSSLRSETHNGKNDDNHQQSKSKARNSKCNYEADQYDETTAELDEEEEELREERAHLQTLLSLQNDNISIDATSKEESVKTGKSDGAWKIDNDQVRRLLGMDHESLETDVTTVLRSGYLEKRSHKRKMWQRRWFVLTPARLAYYKDSKEYELLHFLPLSQLSLMHEAAPPSRPRGRAGSSAASRRRHVLALVATGEHRNLKLAMDSAESFIAWRDAIREAAARFGALQSHPGSRAISPQSTTAAGADGAISPRLSETGDAPLQIVNDESTTIKSGYLHKMSGGKGYKYWRKRWFVLRGDRLSYYGSSEEYTLHRSILRSEIISVSTLRSATSSPVNVQLLEQQTSQLSIKSPLDAAQTPLGSSAPPFSALRSPLGVVSSNLSSNVLLPPHNPTSVSPPLPDSVSSSVPHSAAPIQSPGVFERQLQSGKDYKGKYPVVIALQTTERRFILAADVEEETLAWGQILQNWSQITNNAI